MDQNLLEIDGNTFLSCMTMRKKTTCALVLMAAEAQDHYLLPNQDRQAQRQIFTQRVVVTSRAIVWLFGKQFRFASVPLFHGLQGRFAARS